MAIDIVARGLVTSLLNKDGQIDSSKMPIINTPTGDNVNFIPIGGLTNPTWVNGRTTEELLLAILFGLVNPVLTDPSFHIEIKSKTFLIVGQEQLIEGQLFFNKGEISAVDGSVVPRTGDVLQYTVDGRAVSEEFSINFTPEIGENIVVAKVDFAEGPQPLDSLGNPYDKPYQAGSFIVSFTIHGIQNITTADGAEISFEYFNETDGEGYEAIFVAENQFTKQSFKINKETPILGIKQFNDLAQKWDWIGGSPEASLTTFDLIEDGEYLTYIHNGSLKGERKLKLFVNLEEGD